MNVYTLAYKYSICFGAFSKTGYKLKEVLQTTPSHFEWSIYKKKNGKIKELAWNTWLFGSSQEYERNFWSEVEKTVESPPQAAEEESNRKKKKHKKV